MDAGIGAEGDAVAVHVAVAAELFGGGLQVVVAHHLAAVEAAGVVPLEGLGQPLVHADVEVQHDEDRGLQAVRQIEGERAHFETFAGIGRQQHRVLGVAVAGIGGGQQVRLLGAGGHAGGGAAALDVKDHGGDLGEVA